MTAYHPSCKRTGFTLIEVMIVVVILSLLATMVVPKIMNRPDKVRQQRAALDIANIKTALQLFHTDVGRYPTTAEGLAALVTDPGLPHYDPDGYLEKVPLDPWGRPYVYLSPGLEGRPFDLESYGKDGEDGGTGYNADIESWNLD